MTLCLVAGALIQHSPLSVADEARPFQEATRAGGELKYVDGIPVLFLQGEPEEMGRQQALLIAEAARPLAGIPKSMMRFVLGRDAGAEAAWPVVVALCKARLQKAPERYRRELQAVAETIQLTEEERDALIVANVVFELRPGGCSALVLEPPRSESGEILFGRNLDLPPFGDLDRHGLVTIYRPEGKRAVASVGFPAFAGVLSGMNDAGLTLATHSVGISKEKEPGFNPLGDMLYPTFRRILEECSTIEEAEAFLRKSKGFGKSLLLVASDRKRSVVFEITTRKIVVRDAKEGLLVCTNHFRTPELCVSEDCWRYNQLALLSRSEVPIEFADVRQAMQLVGGESTLQAIIFEPESLCMHVALGSIPVWDRPFVRLDFKALFEHDVVQEE
jgi:hypothetical protein